jgi:catalase
VIRYGFHRDICCSRLRIWRSNARTAQSTEFLFFLAVAKVNAHDRDGGFENRGSSKETIMPLPTDDKIVALSNKIVAQFDAIFGLHPCFRPAHAKGAMLSGTFTPTPGAASLTRAAHMNRASTPVTARFSDSTGLPMLADNDANADPRGLAIRFQLAEHVHTDIIAHSVDGFPTHTADEFLELLQAAAASDPKKTSDPANP